MKLRILNRRGRGRGSQRKLLTAKLANLARRAGRLMRVCGVSSELCVPARRRLVRGGNALVRAQVLPAGTGSFDCVRLAPHFAQDDTIKGRQDLRFAQDDIG